MTKQLLRASLALAAACALLVWHGGTATAQDNSDSGEITVTTQDIFLMDVTFANHGLGGVPDEPQPGDDTPEDETIHWSADDLGFEGGQANTAGVGIATDPSKETSFLTWTTNAPFKVTACLDVNSNDFEHYTKAEDSESYLKVMDGTSPVWLAWGEGVSGPSNSDKNGADCSDSGTEGRIFADSDPDNFSIQDFSISFQAQYDVRDGHFPDGDDATIVYTIGPQ